MNTALWNIAQELIFDLWPLLSNGRNSLAKIFIWLMSMANSGVITVYADITDIITDIANVTEDIVTNIANTFEDSVKIQAL